MKKLFLVLVAVFAVLSAFAQSYSKTERIYWLSHIWKDVADNFYDPDRLAEIKWDSLYLSYIPLVEKATDDAAYARTLQRFMAHVQDGHTEVFFTPDGHKNTPYRVIPFSMYYIQGAYYISDWAADIFPGLTLPQEVVSIDGISMEAYLEKYHMPSVSGSTPQWRRPLALNEFYVSQEEKTITMVLREPGGKKTTTHTLRYAPLSDFDGMEVQYLKYPHKRGDNIYPFEDKNGKKVFLFDLKGFGHNTFLSEQLKQQAAQIESSDYIVVDLRGNSGGSEPMADTLLMHLLDVDTLYTYPSQHRVHHGQKAASGYLNFIPENRPYYENRAIGISGSSAYVKTGTDIPTFTRPLYVLIGPRTFSAAEDFLIPLLLNYPDRATFIGMPTGGSTGAPLVRHIKGNELAYRICTRGAIVSDDYTKKGIQPHLFYDAPLEDYITGHEHL